MNTFENYLKSIIPLPVEIVVLSGYKYVIKAVSKLVDEDRNRTRKRLEKNKRIKTFEGWHLCKDLYHKFAVIEFAKIES